MWLSSCARDEETTTRWRTYSTSTTSKSRTTPPPTERAKRSVGRKTHTVDVNTCLNIGSPSVSAAIIAIQNYTLWFAGARSAGFFSLLENPDLEKLLGSLLTPHTITYSAPFSRPVGAFAGRIVVAGTCWCLVDVCTQMVSSHSGADCKCETDSLPEYCGCVVFIIETLLSSSFTLLSWCMCVWVFFSAFW